MAFAGETAQHAEPFRNGNQLCKGLNAHLLHHLVPVSLDGAFRRSQLLRDLLVDLALHDELENLMLARRQGTKLGAKRIQSVLGTAYALVMRHGPLDCAEQLL